MDAEENSRHRLVQSWREVQLQISSNVIVPIDHAVTIPSQLPTHHGRFRMVHPRTSLSSSTSPQQLLIGGLDVSYFGEQGNSTTDDDKAIAVYVILKYTTNAWTSPQVVHRSHKCFHLRYPYIPSYLAFREVEPMLELISSQIQSLPDLKPDVLLVDGNGQWHERKAGIASFVGVKTGIPTIGVGKSFYSIDGIMQKADVFRDVRWALSEWYDTMIVMGGGNNNDGHDINDNGGSRHCGTLILDTVAIPTGALNNADKIDDNILASLSQISNGIAIPMKGCAIGNDSREILAYALIGHGGRKNTTKISTHKKHHTAAATESAQGSKNPIYISVGSHISLIDAVILCAEVCITRIPEPIREADLYGRTLAREMRRSMFM